MGRGRRDLPWSRGRGRPQPPEITAEIPTLDTLPGSPRIVPRSEHSISRKLIDPDALKVMSRLLRHGFRAFLVGGGVRDLLLGKHPKDFDIGTDARPENVRALFRNSRIIGRRFKINHVFFGPNKNLEVSTFRDSREAPADQDNLLITSDNVYGDPETDALRRDLTINGLFYDLASFSVIDYVGGLDDLKNRIIRTIGVPSIRFEEDPVRMIRAVRHAARTGFTIEPETYEAIIRCAPKIRLCSTARVLEELLRECRGGYAVTSFRYMRDTQLFGELLPFLQEAIAEDPTVLNRLENVLLAFDRAAHDGIELSPALIFLALSIGNLPESIRTEPVEEGAPIPAWLLFGLPQQLVELGLLDPAYVARQNSNLRPKQAAGMRSRAKPRTRELEKLVDRLFHSLGVSRKDRELMEELLVGRNLLLSGAIEETYDRSTLKRSFFEPALTLLRLTAYDELTRKAIAFWENLVIGEEEQQTKPRRRRRKRRGRGRRAGEPGTDSGDDRSDGDDAEEQPVSRRGAYAGGGEG